MCKFSVFAHRGASGYIPENTMMAFKRAIKDGSDGIELDVQLTRDGIPVVIHDENLDRLTMAEGYVKDFSLEELRELKLVNNFETKFGELQIPTLDDVLCMLQNWSGEINIELKTDLVEYKGIEKKVIDCINKFDLEDQTIISSFNHKSLKTVRKLAPYIRTSLLFDGTEKNFNIGYIKKYNPYSVNVELSDNTEESILEIKNAGCKVLVYTVNTKDDLIRMKNANVDGVFTDYVDKIMH